MSAKQWRLCSLLLLPMLLLLPVSLGDGAAETAEFGGPEEALGGPSGQCVSCCGSQEPPPLPPIQLNLAVLRGDTGDRGKTGAAGRGGRPGRAGIRGHVGAKGSRGETGPPGIPCKRRYAAFSLGRRSPLHSENGSASAPLAFDSTLLIAGGRADPAAGTFTCDEPGIYHVALTVHTWNSRETYAHLMRNDEPTAVLYAQPSGRSVMQSQSLLLPLNEGDRLWVRLHDGDRPNAVFGDSSDLYITFNGHLVQPLAA